MRKLIMGFLFLSVVALIACNPFLDDPKEARKEGENAIAKAKGKLLAEKVNSVQRAHNQCIANASRYPDGVRQHFLARCEIARAQGFADANAMAKKLEDTLKKDLEETITQLLAGNVSTKEAKKLFIGKIIDAVVDIGKKLAEEFLRKELDLGNGQGVQKVSLSWDFSHRVIKSSINGTIGDLRLAQGPAVLEASGSEAESLVSGERRFIIEGYLTMPTEEDPEQQMELDGEFSIAVDGEGIGRVTNVQLAGSRVVLLAIDTQENLITENRFEPSAVSLDPVTGQFSADFKLMLSSTVFPEDSLFLDLPVQGTLSGDGALSLFTETTWDSVFSPNVEAPYPATLLVPDGLALETDQVELLIQNLGDEPLEIESISTSNERLLIEPSRDIVIPPLDFLVANVTWSGPVDELVRDSINIASNDGIVPQEMVIVVKNGDPNGNGIKWEPREALEMQQMIVQLIPWTGTGYAASDQNADGLRDSIDVLCMLQKNSKLIVDC